MAVGERDCLLKNCLGCVVDIRSDGNLSLSYAEVDATTIVEGGAGRERAAKDGDISAVDSEQSATAIVRCSAFSEGSVGKGSIGIRMCEKIESATAVG